MDNERSKRSGEGAGAVAGDADLASPGKRPLAGLDASGGAPLPDGVRTKLEAKLGVELGGVRVHVDSNAAKVAEGMNARAFTVGQSIYFGSGHYDPGSAAGQQLIAHEVAHTVQQRGAAPAGNEIDVSTPGDSHEQEAESFADKATAAANQAPAAGAAPTPVTPVSKGVVQRAMIQRDLLDGKPNAALDQPAGPIKAHPPTAADIAEKTSESIRKARSAGGTQAVIQMVHTLRANASADTKGTIESTIASELTEDEKNALSGKSSDAKAANAQSSAPAKEDRSELPAKTGADAKAAHADKTANAAGKGEHADTKPGADAKPGMGEHAAAAGDKAAGGEHDAAGGDAAAGGHDAGAAKKPGANKGEKGDKGATAKPGGAHGAAAGAAGHGSVPGAEHHEAPQTEQKPITPEAGKELIEQELAFHDRWKVYQGGAGQRALHLARTMFYADNGGSVAGNIMGSDLVAGTISGGVFVAGGLAVKLLATKTPLSRIPGVGNIIGGGLSAYALFGHGGAGIKTMAGNIGKGFGGAFSAKNWKESPFATAANLVEGISSTLELVGHVCNMLAGLAYAFSAIAAVGGLLSIFFPPLAFLVPYIPVAINFARACSGIATVCFGVSYLLSPVTAILRALHQIFSDQDPVKLAEEEDEYHSAAQSAVANYSSTKIEQKIDQHGIKPLGIEGTGKGPEKVLGSSFIGENVKEIGEGAHLTKTSLQRGSVDNARQALGSERPATEVSRDYFNPDNRTKVAEGQKAKEEKRLGQEKKDLAYTEHRADVATARRDANPTKDNFDRSVSATATAERHEARVEAQHHKVELAEARTQIPAGLTGERGVSGLGGIGGESGDGVESLFDDAVERREGRKKKLANEAAEAVESNEGGGGEQGGEGGHGGGEAHAAPIKDAKGHIILPEPPGNLQQVESIDQAIEKLEGEKNQLHSTGADARATQHDAAQRAQGLKTASTDVKQYATTKATHSQQEQARIHTQTADIQTKSAQAHGKISQGGNQASAPIRGVAAGARTVDGLLQRVPSNKFFDISSAKNNVHQFVVGMDEIMGVDGHNQQEQGKTNAAIAERNQKTTEAAAKNQQGNAQANKLAADMTSDASTASTAATQAGAVADQAKEAEASNEAKIQQLRAERQQKWQALLGWAAKHRSLRESATKSE